MEFLKLAEFTGTICVSGKTPSSPASHRLSYEAAERTENSDHLSEMPRLGRTKDTKQWEEDVRTTGRIPEKAADPSAAARPEGDGERPKKKRRTARWPPPTAPSSKSGTVWRSANLHATVSRRSSRTTGDYRNEQPGLPSRAEAT